MTSKIYIGVHLYFRRLIAREISASVRFFDRACVLPSVSEPNQKNFLQELEAKEKILVKSFSELKNFTGNGHERAAVILDGNLNHSLNLEDDITDLHKNISRNTRVFCVVYNSHLVPIYQFFRFLGLRSTPLPTSFLTFSSLRSVANLAGFRVVRIRGACFFPWRLWGFGDFLNRWIPALPLIRRFSLCSIVILQPKPLPKNQSSALSLTILVPARNERGNIEPLIQRLIDFPAKIELIFVEGHSTDGTWEEIQRCQKIYGEKFSIKCLKQGGQGKADAVRLGFSKATGDLLTILDADLTMPPESLLRFYEAYARGEGDFINGNRLLYPMEGEAMRFLNWLGNLFFARAMSFVLDTYLGDTLCGTKLMARHDYARFSQWREEFGDFDPFGDFELLFPAAIMGLGIVDIPIHYKARTYGETKIHRFRHGFMLLWMVIVGLLKVKPSKVE